MIETILVGAPMAYCAIGVLVVGFILFCSWREEGLSWREVADDFGTILACVFVWPLLVWAMFHSGDQ